MSKERTQAQAKDRKAKLQAARLALAQSLEFARNSANLLGIAEEHDDEAAKMQAIEGIRVSHQEASRASKILAELLALVLPS